MKDLSVIEKELWAGDDEIPGTGFSIPPSLNELFSSNRRLKSAERMLMAVVAAASATSSCRSKCPLRGMLTTHLQVAAA